MQVLLPVESAVPEDRAAAGALRSLLGWGSAAPLDVHLIGQAMSIIRVLTNAAPRAASASVLRSLKAHRWTVRALRLPDSFSGAMHAAFPSCAASALSGRLVRLFAPAFVAASASYALLLDPYALLMLPPLLLMQHLRAEAAAGHSAGSASRHAQCAYGTTDWLALAMRPAAPPPPDLALLYVDLSCARQAGWMGSLGSKLRRVLAGGGSAQLGCPGGALIGEVATHRPRVGSLGGKGGKGDDSAAAAAAAAAATMRGRPDRIGSDAEERSRLGCEWSYEPWSHAALGHHRVVTVASEGLASLYVTCTSTLVHQAFAATWQQAHDAVYAGRACGCSQRLQVLQYPRDTSGGYWRRPSVGGGVGGSPQPSLHIAGQPHDLTLLWHKWAELPEDAWRWMREHYARGRAPEAVDAYVDRTRDGDPLLVLPRVTPPPSPPSAAGAADAASSAREDRAAAGTEGAVPLIYPCGYAGAEEAWIPQVLLRGCGVRVVCLADLLRDLSDGRSERVAAAVVPGAVFVLQSQQIPIAESLAASQAVAVSSLVLVHLSNGNIWQHAVRRNAAEYARWRHSFRQYWLPDASGELAAARERGEVEWFPIGMNPQWVRWSHDTRRELASGPAPSGDADAGRAPSVMPLASRRTHFVSFLGSTDKSDRAERIALVDRALRGMSVRSMGGGIALGEGVEARQAPRVFHRAGNVACYGSGCADEAYVRMTVDSAPIVTNCHRLPPTITDYH